MSNSRNHKSEKEPIIHDYSALFEHMSSGFAYHKIITNDFGTPIDYIFLDVNTSFEILTGLKKEDILNKAVTEVIPGIEPIWIKKYGEVGLTGNTIRFMNYSKELNRYYETVAYCPKKGYFAVTFNDVTEKKKAEIKLKEREEQFRATFNSTPSVLFLIDKNGRIVNLNKQGLILGNTTLEESFNKLPGDALNCINARGKGCSMGDICSDCTLLEASANTFKHKRSRAMVEAKYSFYNNHDIQEKYFQISTEYLSSLTQPLVLVKMEDITAQKETENNLRYNQVQLNEKKEEYEAVNEELRQTNEELYDSNHLLLESEEKYRNLFENSLVALYRTSITDGEIIECNLRFAKLLGYNTIEQCKKNFSVEKHYVNTEDRKKVLELINKGGKFEEVVVQLYTANQKRLWVNLSSTTYLNKGFIEGGAIDITELVETAAELENKQRLLQKKNEEYEVINKELSQTIYELNKKNILLEEAIEKANESDRLKTSFLANMSHEIRTPLNGITGFVSLLKQDLPKKKFNLYTDVIQKSSDQLISIINNILDLSKIEAGVEVIEYQEFPVSSILQNLYEEFSIQLNNRDVTIEHVKNPSNITVNADRIKFTQIFYNLLSNAIKFTPKGKIFFGYDIEGNTIKFYVKDTGIGIKESDQKIIFDHFRQVEMTESREYSGTGIGLSLVKSYVELMNGKVWLDSEYGKGASFYFSLPHYSVSKAEDEHVIFEKFTENWEGKHILIVEDDIVSQNFLLDLLTDNNPILYTASNGLEAIDIIKKNPVIDLVLLDIKMPVLNGYDAIKEIKKHWPEIPVIAQTAFAFKEDQNKINAAGFDGFISKPIKIEKLYPLINSFLNQKK